MPSIHSKCWYAEAIEHTGTLRWHLEEILQEAESCNRFAKQMGYPLLSEAKIKAAREAQANIEAFFTGNAV
jgi:hypothetical protein